MIMKWNESSLEEGVVDWQQYLWMKARVLSAMQLPDKTLVGAYILKTLRQGENIDLLRAYMPAIHVFGLSITTGYHLTLFYEIARHVDFSFHILNPAPAVYWFEDKSEKQLAWMKKKGFAEPDEMTIGNPLLTSWGRVIQNTFHLFFQNDEMLNVYEEAEFEEPVPDSLLGKIQHDIFFNLIGHDRNEIYPEDLGDGSVTISSCFTPAREVEVLYNYLVHLIDKRQEELSPRDIVVMVSDIDAYAPYIKAVFSNVPYKFQYTIADENFTHTDTISNALHSLFSISEDNFGAEEVLQLLDSSYIRKRFGITDLQLIRSAVGNANIRFGMEGDVADDTVYVSWKYGIQRLMYGICMLGSEEYGAGKDGFYPVDSIEGSASYEIIRFCHFMEVLMDSVRQRKQVRTIAGWVQYTQGVLENLVWDLEEGTEEDFELLLAELNKYNLLTPMVDEEIRYDVFSYKFLQTISGSTRAGAFVQGGITFCSLIPMRSIPFKVVALLGLDFDKFPRKENPVSFNLLEKDKKRGDRNVKENDKHLFLETILSAHKYFYISYIGQSARDNTALPPSALIDELIDYIESGTFEKRSVKENLITHHPLHGFSQKYQGGDDRLFSYITQMGSGMSLAAENRQHTVSENSELSLRSLVSFFKNPIKGYYNDVLGIYYRLDKVLMDETELFELDKLQQWQLKQDLLRAGDEDIAGLRKKLVKTGGLPLKSMAEISLGQLEKEVLPVRSLFKACIGDACLRSVSLELTVDSVLLKGSLDQVYGDMLVYVSWSKHEMKYLIDAYIQYLFARAAGENLSLFFVSAIKGQVYEGAAISKAEAMERLSDLLILYRMGHSQILAFYPDFHVDPSDFVQLSLEKFNSLVKKKFADTMFPSSDTYALKEYGKGFFSGEDAFHAFVQNTERILVPLTQVFPTYF
jgi:exodeoxyribonuclease V gamma subunit